MNVMLPILACVSPATGWFNMDAGANYNCADDEGEDYCSQYKVRGAERLTDLDERVANDSLENDPYTVETKWMLKGELYKKLDENPELQDSLQVMEEFYADLQGSNTAAFKAIDDEQLALYELDSTVAEQLQANSVQIDSLSLLVQAGLVQLGDSLLSEAQLQVMLEGISSDRVSIQSLSAWNSTTMEAILVSKTSAANGVQAANQGITTNGLIEENARTVNDLYLATIGKDVDTFTTTQADDLFAIANQCPMVGGNAVFKARSLYSLIDDAQQYDDSLLCIQYGFEVKRLSERRTNAMSVVPNPTSDEARLVLALALEEASTLLLYDALGGEVMRHAVPIGIPRIAFSTASLAPALYHYELRGPSGIMGVGKLTIVR